MIIRSIVATSAILTASLLAVHSARAECIEHTAKGLLEHPNTELAFSGKVVEITPTPPGGYRATFEVERVWKGSVTKRFDIYISTGEPERPRFEADRQYVVFAERANTRIRDEAGLNAAAPMAFTPVTCSYYGYAEWAEVIRRTIQELGPGEPPKPAAGRKPDRITPRR